MCKAADWTCSVREGWHIHCHLVVYLPCVAIVGFNGSTVSGSGGSKCGAGTIGPYFVGAAGSTCSERAGISTCSYQTPGGSPCSWLCEVLITPSVGMVS